MEELSSVLLQRMVSKGMEVTNIPAYMRNVANALAKSRNLDLQQLNAQLQSLGWDDFELDDYTLCLIEATLESNPKYDQAHWFDSSLNSEKPSQPVNWGRETLQDGRWDKKYCAA